MTLVREDPLARFVSSQLLQQDGQVAAVEGDKPAPDGRGITLNPETILADLSVIEAENKSVAAIEAVHKGPVFSIKYESFFAASEHEQQEQFSQLQQFLGCAVEPLKGEHRKLGRKKLSETISNYPEIREVLLPSSHRRWLDEEKLRDLI